MNRGHRPTRRRPCLALAPLLTAVAVFVTGCNSPMFHSAASPAAGKTTPPVDPAQAATVGEGWSGDRRADDSDHKAMYHQVHAGETLSEIAAIYGVSLPRLLLANNGLDAGDGLKPGQLIHIPRPR